MITFTLITLTEKTCIAQNTIIRDSLTGEFGYSTRACNTGLINIYDDSTCTITGIPGCYSCVVLDECGTWKIKRKYLLIESPKDNLIKSKLLKDSCATIVNLAGNNGEIHIWKNGCRGDKYIGGEATLGGGMGLVGGGIIIGGLVHRTGKK